MDVKVSRKETRYQPSGAVDVLKNNIFDLYPIFSVSDENAIEDIEIIDGDREELLDRGLSACVFQKGMDPVSPDVGIQWAEGIAGEVSFTSIISQLQDAVREEGTGLKIVFSTVDLETSKSLLSFELSLTNTI